MRRRNIGAFSLIEVLVSLAIISIAVLGVLASLAYGVKSGTHAELISQAINRARYLVDFIRANRLDYTSCGSGAIASWSECEDTSLNAQIRGASPLLPIDPKAPIFKRRIVISPLKAGPKTGGPDDYRVDLARIQVEVLWYERSRLRKVQVVSLHSCS